MKTIVLLSGGLDSATVLAACIEQGDECFALGFSYAQPHGIELNHAALIALQYGVKFDVLNVPSLPKVDDVVFGGRNLLFASYAISIAQVRKFDRIAVGCNASDWARFPDCRPDFWRHVAKCAEAYGVGVITPLIYLSKRDVVEAARKLNVPIDLTWSCYSPTMRGEPCRECLACTTRQEALQ